MGYESHWTGEVRIAPPLAWAEIKNSRQSPGFQDLKLRLVEQVEDTATGQIRAVTAVAVETLANDRGSYSGYTVEEELQAVVDAHPGHEFTGAIEARPLDPGGTPWRYVIQGRQVVRQEPRLVWPGELTPADACQFHAPAGDPCAADGCGHAAGADCHPRES